MPKDRKRHHDKRRHHAYNVRSDGNRANLAALLAGSGGGGAGRGETAQIGREFGGGTTIDIEAGRQGEQPDPLAAASEAEIVRHGTEERAERAERQIPEGEDPEELPSPPSSAPIVEGDPAALPSPPSRTPDGAPVPESFRGEQPTTEGGHSSLPPTEVRGEEANPIRDVLAPMREEGLDALSLPRFPKGLRSALPSETFASGLSRKIGGTIGQMGEKAVNAFRTLPTESHGWTAGRSVNASGLDPTGGEDFDEAGGVTSSIAMPNVASEVAETSQRIPTAGAEVGNIGEIGGLAGDLGGIAELAAL